MEVGIEKQNLFHGTGGAVYNVDEDETTDDTPVEICEYDYVFMGCFDKGEVNSGSRYSTTCFRESLTSAGSIIVAAQ